MVHVFPMQQSGLSDWLGDQLRVLGSLPHPVIALLVSVMVASTTEVMSNIATTTLFLPVLRNLVSAYNVSLVHGPRS
jgi:sodium-dependent dicarboxylate transporter 2/3/5